MSNAQKAVDLLKSGPETIAELINMNNRTNYVHTQLVIGAPTSSKDVEYNTDIEVTFPTDPEPTTGELHYHRLDLGRLFAQKNIRLRDNGYDNVNDLIPALLGEARIAFDTDDLNDDPISGAYPRAVLIRANPLSLRFTGQFSIDVLEPITPDTSFITAPTNAEGSPTGKALKSDGTLWYGNDLSAAKMLTATNGEIELAASVRMVGLSMVFGPQSGDYVVDINANGDWVVPYSIQLVDTRNGEKITDLYDVTLSVEAAQSGGVLDFELQRLYGRLILKDTDNNLTVDNASAYPESQALYQSELRVADYQSKLGSLTRNDSNIPYGTFTVTLTATRKTGSLPDVSISFDAIISATGSASATP